MVSAFLFFWWRKKQTVVWPFIWKILSSTFLSCHYWQRVWINILLLGRNKYYWRECVLFKVVLNDLPSCVWWDLSIAISLNFFVRSKQVCNREMFNFPLLFFWSPSINKEILIGQAVSLLILWGENEMLITLKNPLNWKETLKTMLEIWTNSTI